MYGLDENSVVLLILAAAAMGALVAIFVCRRIFDDKLRALSRQLNRSEAALQTTNGLLEQSRQQSAHLWAQLRRLQGGSPRGADGDLPTPSSWMELPEVVDHSMVDFPDTEPSRGP